MTSLNDALRRLIDWFDRAALPLWAKAGYDAARGGFYESLDFSGAPVAEAPRRVRVQARQVHVFAVAAAEKRHPDAERLARAGFAWLREKACPEGGARGCVHLLDADGRVLDSRRDLYDQAFLLLACASMRAAFADAEAESLAGRVMAFLDRDLAAPAGGWAEDDRGSLPRRQNPHMHLFEAFLALYGATGEAGWLDRAGAVHALFETRFFNAAEGTLREFFTQSLEPAAGEAGAVIEPGHMAEWVALLARYETAGGVETRAARRALFEAAARLGAIAPRGFLADRIVLGAAAQDAAARLWPQTEYLKACLALARDGDAAAAARAAALIEALFDTYLAEPVAGLWRDRFDGEGKPAAADAPASILYHLFDAVREAEGFLKEG